MSLLASLLDKFDDDHAFESMCIELLHREGYTQIEPIGGSDDKGRDAQQRLFSGGSVSRTIFFQFTLQSTFRSKVRQTLERLREAKKSANTVLFVFSKRVSPTLKDQLVDFALTEFEQDIEVKDQRFLVSRLGQKAYREVTQRYFAKDIAELRMLWEEDALFADTTELEEHAKRVLINLVHYTQHPFSSDMRVELLQRTIQGALCNESQALPIGELLQSVRTLLPQSLIVTDDDLRAQIDVLAANGELAKGNGDIISLPPAVHAQIALDIGEVVHGRRALYNTVLKFFAPLGGAAPSLGDVRKATLRVFSTLFRNYGLEIANAILDRQTDETKTALNPDEVATAISSNIPPGWAPIVGDAFRTAIKSILANPPADVVGFLARLSSSYILMQVLNLDPSGINALRERMIDSVALLDTDVVLTGLVEGTSRHSVSRRIIDLCSQLGIKCFAGSHELKEIVLRIERSIRLYNELGRPSVLPDDKADLITDLFLDVYYRRLKAGTAGTFDDFITRYYDPSKPQEFLRALIEQDLGIEVKDINSFLLIPQEDKIKRLQNTIEALRKGGGRFKHAELYKSDAIQLVIVEQQNRDALAKNRSGRWFLVSGDGFSFRAYLDHRDAFKVKPCVHPVHFLEKLRNIPQATADESTFGFILQSETMLRGTGRDYGPLIAALTKIGVNALDMGRTRLLELVEDMERADFTQWLYRIWSGEEVDNELRDEVATALRKLIGESKSRDDEVRVLRKLLDAERAKRK